MTKTQALLNTTLDHSRCVATFGRRSLSIAILASCAVPTVSQQTIKPEDQQTTLTGTIRLIHDYGPPGYGEDPKHDSHVRYWAIVPSFPVNFACSPEKQKFAETDCAPAKRINLYFPGLELKKLDELPAAKWNGREVIVTGELHRADTAGEMTPIYMDVTSIAAAAKEDPKKR